MLAGTVSKFILSNGMTLLVMPQHDIPKVSLQLFYNVGAKDEESGHRGLAHFIEHMIFKGTKKLTESDINVLVHRLSGSCNAFTSHDYTGYSFDVPSHNWKHVVPVMADCMQNCSFKQEHINSELKAVVQEIKMYNDDYASTLIEQMMRTIFPDHPYHYPIIGYKQDLWKLKREDLVSFYKQHYGPNNATLVVVGDVNLEEVRKEIEKSFGTIEPLVHYEKKEHYHSPDIISHHISLKRDVQQPFLLLGWKIPGMSSRQGYLWDTVSWILGSGRGSRLYQLLAHEHDLVTEVQSFVYDCFDHGLFFIYIQPKNLADVNKIKQLVTQELHYYQQHGPSCEEVVRAHKKTYMDFLSLQEDFHKQAYLLGKLYLATGDENYLSTYCAHDTKALPEKIQQLMARHLTTATMHSGIVESIAQEDISLWQQLQDISDEEDQRILSKITRTNHVEEPCYAHDIVLGDPAGFSYPKAQKIVLDNGLTVLYHHRPGMGKIDCILDLKAKHFYDPADKQGLSIFMTDLLQEGTHNYTAHQLAQEIEMNGMELNALPGQFGMTMLKGDAKKGLDIFAEVLMRPLFAEDAIERVRAQVLAEVKAFWDRPSQFIGQIAREEIYQKHPHSHNILGDEHVLRTCTREDILQAYEHHITPQGARLAIVGDLDGYDIESLVKSAFGDWKGENPVDIKFTDINPVKQRTLQRYINRDQAVLCYAGLSVNRGHEDYDKLLIFDQIFTGGVLGSMSSRLFDLRERTGLFYTIGGSLLAGSTKEPGLVFIKTITSNDRLEEAEQAIEQVINQGADSLTDQEINEAQQALVNSLVDNFAANRQMAATFLYIDKYDLPTDYFAIRPQQLLQVTKEDVQKVVKKYLDTQKLIKIKIGRTLTSNKGKNE